jgi:hypothetical protein
MAKKSKFKVPKRVLGVKVPKSMRKTGSAVLANPMTRAMLAEALVLVGAALVAKQSRRGSTARNLVEHPMAAAERIGNAGLNAASSLGSAAGGASMTLGRAIEGLVNYIRSADDGSSVRAVRKTKKRGGGKRRKSAGRSAEHRVH